MYGVGRFAGATLMFWFNPGRLLAIFAASGLLLAGIATVYGGEIGVYAMVASSLSMSITYATILGTAIRDLGPLTKSGTALVYMGGAGSAIGVTLMHVVWTFSSIQLAMIVPMIGYAGVLAFALMSSRADTVQNAVAKAAVP
jgi:FHS family L-fucose permease-like MFS transporter